jgi:hypothetical protein
MSVGLMVVWGRPAVLVKNEVFLTPFLELSQELPPAVGDDLPRKPVGQEQLRLG